MVVASRVLSCLVVAAAGAGPSAVAAQSAEATATTPATTPSEETPANELSPDISAEERQRDEEIFGAYTEEDGDGDRVVDSDPAPAEYTSPPAGEERLAAALRERDDSVVLGGFLYSRLDYALEQATPLGEGRLSSPSFLDLFVDARPVPRTRAYARGRLRYDFTTRQADDLVSAVTSVNRRPAVSADLDQLWLKFDVGKQVFVTLGRQPVRWGTGRLWNPTDFLNAQTRDPFALFDDRIGLGLLKLHLPIESLGWNLYAIANFDGADSANFIGGALRAEFLAGQTEMSLSAAGRKQRDDPVSASLLPDSRSRPLVQLGGDISSALGPLDIRAEASVQQGLSTVFFRGELDIENLVAPTPFSRADKWIFQGVASVEYSHLYSEQDSVILGAEYFYNQTGYGSAAPYLAAFAAGTFRPLYMGRHYASAFVFLAAPGSWNDSSILLSGVANLSDGSVFARLDYNINVLTLLRINVYGSTHAGKVGEFRYSAEPVDPDFVDLAVDAGLPAAAAPLLKRGIRGPLLEVGASARLNF